MTGNVADEGRFRQRGIRHVDPPGASALNEVMRLPFPALSRRPLVALLAAFAMLGATGVQLLAEVRLHPAFSDHAVLQRDLRVPVWGTASEGEMVTVEFAGQQHSAVTKAGHWMVELRPMKANNVGAALKVTGPHNSQTIQDVVVGEVWICSGQSNMEWPMSRSFEPEADIAGSTNPNVRLFTVVKRKAPLIKTDLDYAAHAWKVAASESVRGFSAVGYYFGRDLEAALRSQGVPVGLIHTSWGGSPAEVWMREDVLRADAEYANSILGNYETARTNYERALARWEADKAAAEARGESFTRGRPGAPWRPAELYNGMIANLIPYGIRGAIWYQGESNAGRAWQYRRLFADMITNWRADWGQGDFPFYAVQLAPWDRNRRRDLAAIGAEIGNSDWAELREAQNHVAATLRNVEVAVITDVGDKDDIHPTRKAPVGERLSLLARARVHGEKVVAHGPRLRSSRARQDALELRFKDVGAGLKSQTGTPLTGFTLAGADMQFHPATAEIVGKDRVVLRSVKVPQPVAARYGWHDYPIVNLANSAGLPASPFRTDTWKVTTQP